MNCKNYKYIEHYQSVVQGEMPKPVMLLLYPVQGTCNHRCYYCQIEDMEVEKIMMPTDQIIKLLHEAKELGCRSFEVCGLDSEPMLHKDLGSIFTIAGGLGYRCSMLTNGSLITPEFAEVVARHFDYIRFSVDSFEEKTFNEIRDPRDGHSLDHVLRGINRVVHAVAIHCKEVPCTVGVKVSLVPQNNSIDHLVRMINKAYMMGVNSISFKRAIHSTIEHPDDEYYLDLEAKILEQKEALWPGMDIYFKLAADEPLKKQCLITPYHLFVDANGDVPLCCYHWNKEGHVFGNINKNSLREIWHGPEHMKAIKQTRVDECNWYQCKAAPINNFCEHESVENHGHLDFFG